MRMAVSDYQINTSTSQLQIQGYNIIKYSINYIYFRMVCYNSAEYSTGRALIYLYVYIYIYIYTYIYILYINICYIYIYIFI